MLYFPVNISILQVRNVGQSVVEERTAHDHDVIMLREDLAVAKQNLAETQKRESQVLKNIIIFINSCPY